MAEYLLGIVGPSNKAADKGTIVHKVLELIAKIQQAKLNKQKTIIFPECGKISIYKYDINDLIEKVYIYYSTQITHYEWKPTDFKDCKNWTWKALQYNKGQFDPRKIKIVKPELSFDFIVEEPWAMYDYTVDDKKIQGFLGLKGTIDFIKEISPTCYECVDYKTGATRKNWATDEIKDETTLRHDPQLRMYHYAIHKIFPQLEQVIMTIFYINAGGPFSICLDKNDLAETEEILKQRFIQIKDCRIPPLNKSWKCSKLCFCGKNNYAVLEKKPLVEFRKGRYNFGQTMTICQQLEFEIQKRGLEKVVQEYTTKDFDVASYRNPGEI